MGRSGARRERVSRPTSAADFFEAEEDLALEDRHAERFDDVSDR